MRILGVDPGFKATGYGFIDYNGGGINNFKVIEAGTIEPKEKDLIQNRIQKVYKYLEELLVQHKPDVLVLEKLYAHYKHPLTACKLGHVRGVICLLCAQRNIKLVEYPVKRIRIALLGNGNATKVQTQSTVANILKVDQSKLSLDASDALALAIGYTYIELRSL